MAREFRQLDWDAEIEDDLRHLVRLAVREDLHRAQDLTTVSLVPHDAIGRAAVVVREAGRIAGLRAAEVVLDEMESGVAWQAIVDDAAAVDAGTMVATMDGPTRSLLTCERIVLNVIGRLSGIASLTAKFVKQVEGTGAGIYDTRKTTPGWRLLEKYAVRCGGGRNHRTGLYDAILIKDNHLAQGADGGAVLLPAEAVVQARRFLQEMGPTAVDPDMIVEVEVDTLEQLENVLTVGPDVVLLDNMSLADLREAVALRGRMAPTVQLEASGGVALETVQGIAETGVDRISVGALTHSAVALDVGLDWLDDAS